MPSGELKVRSVGISLCGYRAHVRLIPAARRRAPTILALHGFTGSGADFGPLREALGGERFGWILPDFMGHGRSESPPVMDPYLLPALLHLVDKCRQLASDPTRIHLLGYSMGGRIALQYLARAGPLPCLLLSASPGLDDPEARRQRRQADRNLIDLRTDTPETFSERWENLPLISPQTRLAEPLASELRDRRRRNSLGGLNRALLASGTGTLPGLWARLPKLPGCRCFHGEKDSKFGRLAESMHRLNPRFSVHQVKDSGHAPHLENPLALAELIDPNSLEDRAT